MNRTTGSLRHAAVQRGASRALHRPPGGQALSRIRRRYLYGNNADSYYNSGQLKWEKRFSRGLSYMLSYAFSKHIDEKIAPTPFAPEGYDRGRSEFDRTHILADQRIYELPFGKGRKYLTNSHPVVNAIFGGWQLAGIYNFISGQPLSFIVPGATLGNGTNTRPNLSGDPKLSNPTADRWFNPQAFSAPAPYTFGNSGIGILEAPGIHVLDTSLTKNFYVTEIQIPAVPLGDVQHAQPCEFEQPTMHQQPESASNAG